MKNILFPFSGENSSVETGVVAKADIASSFGGKFLRRNGGCCKTAGIASSFGGSGGEADDRGQNGSYCKTANIVFFFGSMKNILFPFLG